MTAAHMAYDSSHDCQSLIAPQRVALEQLDLRVLATSADMVCLLRLSQPTFPH